jgi:hypothetical protein
MKVRSGSAFPVCLLLAGLALTNLPAALAQHEAGQAQGPSKYLFLTNVELKPGLEHLYAKAQGDEVQAMRAAKAPSHFIGMWGITGVDHVLYLHGFDTFADAQKEHEATYAMPKLIDALNTSNAAQAPQIVTEHDSVYSYEKDLSLNPGLDLSKMRFMRIIIFHVRSAHDDDFQRLAKQFAKAYQSSIPEARWAMFQKRFGVGSDNTYILITPMESLGEVDGMLGSNKKFTDTVGEDQVQMLYKSLDAALESSESDLFAFDPQLSYAPDSWLSSSPDFWGKK